MLFHMNNERVNIMNMNIQNIMKQAQKMQNDLQKAQKELDKSEYEGNSSGVKIILKGNLEMKSIEINFDGNLSDSEDKEMLEDMISVAYSDALSKVNKDKEKKFGKYGQGLSGLM